MRISGVGELQRRRTFIEDLFNSGKVSPNNHGVIRYVDQSSRTNSAAAIAEGGAFAESALAWTEKQIPIEKVGHYIKISREMMDDVDFVTSQINNELLRDTQLKVDADLLSGSGVSPILIGLATSADAWAVGDYATTVTDASYYDLLAVISAQIMTGTSFMPNGVLMNPLDAVKMKLKKDALNNYVIPTFVIPMANGDISVDGMRVVVNSGVTAGTMYVGDFSRGTVYSSDELQLETGYATDDFTKDLVTIKARRRLALLIRSVDEGAFVKVSDIDAAIAEINSAGA